MSPNQEIGHLETHTTAYPWKS